MPLCYKCGQVFSTTFDFSRHEQRRCPVDFPGRRQTSGIPYFKTEDKKYQCRHCRSTFKSYGALYNHIESLISIHKCKFCGKQFNREGNLRRHEKTCKQRHSSPPDIEDSDGENPPSPHPPPPPGLPGVETLLKRIT